MIFSFSLCFSDRIIINGLCHDNLPRPHSSSLPFSSFRLVSVNWHCCKLNDFRSLAEIEIYPRLFRSEKSKQKIRSHHQQRNTQQKEREEERVCVYREKAIWVVSLTACTVHNQYSTLAVSHTTLHYVMSHCDCGTKIPSDISICFAPETASKWTHTKRTAKKNNRHGKSNVIECVALQRISFAIYASYTCGPEIRLWLW